MGKKKVFIFPEWFIQELVTKEDRELAIKGLLPHSEKVLFFCPIHGSYSQRVSDHFDFKTSTKRKGCPECAKIKRKETFHKTKAQNRPEYPEWFIKELANESDKERAREKTLSSGDVVDFICNKHGIYSTYVYNVIKLSTGERQGGCHLCGCEQRKESMKKTKREKRPEYPAWFIEELKNDEDKERAKNKALKYNEKVTFYCSDHGDYIQAVADHLDYKTGNKKQGCPRCGKLKSFNTRKELHRQKRPDYPEWFINELAHDGDKEKARNKDFTWSDKVEFLCPIHGNYNQRIDAHMDVKTFEKKQGCPKCGKIKEIENRKITSIEKRPPYPQWFIDELAHEDDKERARKNAISSSECLDFICSKHGIYKQHVNNHITISTGEPDCKCPKCGVIESSNEREIFECVKSIHPTVERRNRDTIKSETSNRFMELDIFCKDKNIAVEYNGSLWHGEKFFKGKEYHLNKFLLCEKNQIRLISIFDRDWFENKDKIRNFLKDLFSDKINIQGRKTIVQKISNKEANAFYTLYHLKNGDTSITVSYGLYYNNELISVMSFSKPKFGNQKDVEWDLVRYCVKYGYSVIGGAEKLFNAFLKEYNPSSIVTYSDNDYFTGDVYCKLGFTFSKFTDLPYYWAKDNHFLSRQQCQVKILKEKYSDFYNEAIENNASNKEDYIMHSLGYYKVYRCGNKKWIWKVDKVGN